MMVQTRPTTLAFPVGGPHHPQCVPRVQPTRITSAFDINKAYLRARPARLQDRDRGVQTSVWPMDTAWAPNVDMVTLNDTLAPNLFALSIVPYAGFLYHLTKTKQAPRLVVAGFYFLLVFVFATIPAGIYAKTAYGTALANVDWLHGSAESLLTITNLLIVIGLRQAIRQAAADKEVAESKAAAGAAAAIGEEQKTAAKD